MRTIEDKEKILRTQTMVVVAKILQAHKDNPSPIFMWDRSYWKGYCDCADESGELWKMVKAAINEHTKDEDFITTGF